MSIKYILFIPIFLINVLNIWNIYTFKIKKTIIPGFEPLIYYKIKIYHPLNQIQNQIL